MKNRRIITYDAVCNVCGKQPHAGWYEGSIVAACKQGHLRVSTHLILTDRGDKPAEIERCIARVEVEWQMRTRPGYVSRYVL